MTQSIRTLLYITLFGLIVSGCSGSSSSYNRKPAVVNKINGYVGASNIFQSTIYAVPIDVQGQPTLAEDDPNNFSGSRTTSNSKAYFVASVGEQESSKPVLFIANALGEDKTTQRCELTGGCTQATFTANYPLANNFKLNAAVSSVDNNSRVNINWITHLAADIGYTVYIDKEGDVSNHPIEPSANPAVPISGMYTPFTIERGNLWLSRQFDISDIISIRPIAPSALAEVSDLVSGLREQGIRYGALLSGGQKLAKEAALSGGQKLAKEAATTDANITDDVSWLSSVVKQQRNNRGQFYVNHDTEFSKCRLYTAAEDVLRKNISNSIVLSSDVKGDANNALKKLKDGKDVFCAEDQKGVFTKVEVSIEEIENWVDSFAQGKEFVDDLNKRILNMRCDGIKQNGDENLDGFFDCDYVKRTQTYYQDLEDLYHNNKPKLVGALHEMRDDVTAFINCLNTSAKVSCASNEYITNGLTYTMVPLEETAIKIGGATKYFAFDFRVIGTRELTANGISITFKAPNKIENKEIEASEHNLLRVVYQGDNAYIVPARIAFEEKDGTPPAAGVEPLGFDFNFPNVELKSEPTQQDFKLYVSAKLIGVKPLLDATKAMHYNLTEVGIGLNIQGVKLGEIIEKNKTVELKDTAEFTFKAKFDDAANYYAKTLWPERDDFFKTESGVTEAAKKDFGTELFTYSLQQNKEVLISATTDKDGNVSDQIYGNADYFELEVTGLGANRFEVYQQDKKSLFRNCSIDASATTDEEKEKDKVCTSSEEVDPNFSLIDDLIYSDRKYLENFAVPGYGSYKPIIPDGIQWDHSGVWNGNLEAEFAQGVSNMELRIAQEFVDTLSTGEVKRAPAAILKIQGNKKTETSWEVAVSTGYNYEYLVDVLPMGPKDTQSFYFSYFVNEYTKADGTKSFISELGSLSIIREGTSLFGLEAGSTVNATLASRVDYEIDKTSTDLCGYTKVVEKGAKAKTCNAIAYLTVRGKLVGTLRKENGLYVMRYSDGTFSILGI